MTSIKINTDELEGYAYYSFKQALNGSGLLSFILQSVHQNIDLNQLNKLLLMLCLYVTIIRYRCSYIHVLHYSRVLKNCHHVNTTHENQMVFEASTSASIIWAWYAFKIMRIAKLCIP